jgi:hypothetical protein
MLSNWSAHSDGHRNRCSQLCDAAKRGDRNVLRALSAVAPMVKDDVCLDPFTAEAIVH